MVVLRELEQGSSGEAGYDVFISFRGVDTRLGFTDHLHNALEDANISTFLDDEEIETGEDLKPELERAIKSSRASVIVLSKNYAASTWCLDELALILDQSSISAHIVIPIFYHVEPTHVRKQQGSFGDAMAAHTHKMEAETNQQKKSHLAQKIPKWNKALTQVAGLKGMDAEGRKERELIEEIVTNIHRRFGVPLSSDSLPLLIGMEHKIEEITSWLTDGSCSHAADVLTITGMGGIGKTSLAKYVFHLYSRTFDKSSFIEGINRRDNEQFKGLLDVQKQLYDDISMKNKLRVHDTFVYTSKIVKALARTKVFLVLDDIDTLGQLDALLGKKGFHPGSKIMITTRDASLIERCDLFNPQVQPNHTNILLKGLRRTVAIELLCLHAFKSKDPKAGYEEVIGKVVKYCEGHPLALEVLGRSLHNRDIAYWEECVKGLKKEPHSSINKALQMSFDSLPLTNDKELFKHIACFFVGMDRDLSETILEACDINVKTGITNLIDRCLLSIGWDNRLMMHQLLQEMGKALVHQESPDHPGKRSRLWCHEDSFMVLKRKKGTENLKGLVLDTRMLEKGKLFELKTDAFCNMDNLMLLQLNYVQLSGSYESFPEDIRWLCMNGFPLKSIPADLPMENLVILDMSYSKIESFGIYDNSSNQQPPAKTQKLIGSCSKDKQILGSLKILDLSFCEQLHTLGGFIRLPALERLIVRNCISLTAICESLEECVDLVLIDLSYCINLEKLPTAIGKLKEVKTLLIDGCHRLVAYSIGIDSRTSSCAILESIPRELNFSAISFPRSLVRLSLADNNLSSESFPMDMSRLSLLKYLCLDRNPIVSMPSCVRSLPKLEELSMDDCNMLTSIERPPCTLREMSFDGLSVEVPLQRLVFDKEMSPLKLSANYGFIGHSCVEEIQGVLKIQPMAGVEEKVLRSLGWSNLDFIKNRRFETYPYGRPHRSKTQMYYEFGIFSTFYGGEEMPNWISETRDGASISFTVPSSPKKQQLRGLNFCSVLFYEGSYFPLFSLPDIDALYSEIVKRVEEKFVLNPRQKAVLDCLRAPLAQDFLSVTPIEGLGQRMSAVEYRAILKYRLMIPLFPIDEPCPVCRKACLDSFGEHAVHCKELPGFKYRHDWVRDVLYDVLKRAGISAKKEAPVNFLTDPLEGRSTLRPADILVFGWEGGKHACVDLTGVSPLVGLKDHGFVAGQAALKAELNKVAKHEKACLDNQHVFVPFGFDTFGVLAPDAVRLLKRVQKVVNSNSSTLKAQNMVFSRIGFAIQKGVAAQLVARLPAIVM